ncbi:MAG: riboflavin synthase [Elusimicrobia bacterium]|nr:riboflavin synthase [Elusimicrobiota bacterium]
MFTGITEDVGNIVYIRGGRLCVKSALGDISAGDSVMVDGVCLTVSGIGGGGKYIMDLGAETRRVTAFRNLGAGSPVNLERAMTLAKKIDGHIVYGHVMSVGKVVSVKSRQNTRIMTIRTERAFIGKLILKGSVAVNGVSLTVNEIGRTDFKVGLIPETLRRTNLGRAGATGLVNLEADMLALGAGR